MILGSARSVCSCNQTVATRVRRIAIMSALRPHPVVLATVLLIFSGVCNGQHNSPATGQTQPENTRIFGIIPNYRTFPTLTNYKPLKPKEKFKIAFDDSFDRGTFVLAAAIAGEAQLSKSDRSFWAGH